MADLTGYNQPTNGSLTIGNTDIGSLESQFTVEELKSIGDLFTKIDKIEDKSILSKISQAIVEFIKSEKIDTDLSEQNKIQANEAGRALRESGVSYQGYHSADQEKSKEDESLNNRKTALKRLLLTIISNRMDPEQRAGETKSSNERGAHNFHRKTEGEKNHDNNHGFLHKLIHSIGDIITAKTVSEMIHDHDQGKHQNKIKQPPSPSDKLETIGINRRNSGMSIGG